MLDTVRDSFFGQLVHDLSGGRLFPYPEERPGYQVPNHFVSTDASYDSRDSELEKNDFSGRIVVDWYDENDTANPQNWKESKKLWVAFLICILTTSIYSGAAIYTPGIPEIQAAFGVSSVAATIPLSLYVLGYGIAPMVFSPLSETPSIGRTSIYIITLACFIILQIGCALAPNIGCLIVIRFLAGIAASPVLATGGASMGDILRPWNLPYGIAFWSIAAVCGPVLGPFLGAVMTQVLDWRYTFWLLMWICSLSFIVLFFFLPETQGSTILYRRAKRLRKVTGSHVYVTAAELELRGQTTAYKAKEMLIRPIIIAFTEPAVLALNTYIGLLYAIFYTWFEAWPFVFEDLHHFQLIPFGLTYMGFLIGGILILCLYCFIVWKSISPAIKNPPKEVNHEAMLVSVFPFTLLMPISIFLFGWTSRADIHWAIPLIATILFVIGLYMIFQVTFAYLATIYPRYLASVFAGNDLFRAVMGAAFPLFAKALFERTATPRYPVGWGCSLLGFLTAIFILAPVLIHRYGAHLRARSKYALS